MLLPKWGMEFMTTICWALYPILQVKLKYSSKQFLCNTGKFNNRMLPRLEYYVCLLYINCRWLNKAFVHTRSNLSFSVFYNIESHRHQNWEEGRVSSKTVTTVLTFFWFVWSWKTQKLCKFPFLPLFRSFLEHKFFWQ